MIEFNRAESTWKDFIDCLEEHDVKVIKDWRVFECNQEYTFNILQYKQVNRVNTVQVTYDPHKVISKFSIRSICYRLGIDSSDIEFDLL